MACSTDPDDVKEELTNGAPSIESQSFTINEHAVSGTLIGTVQATGQRERCIDLYHGSFRKHID